MRNLRTEDEIIANWKGDIDKPVVSICCITYNHEPYIEDALEGFLIQETDFPFEILIHDDASTDRTADIIREYEAKYPRLIKPIYQTENQYSKGVKPNPEFNYPRAKGEYIALCEGDDYWVDPTKTQKQVDYLDSNPNVVISSFDAFIIDDNGDQVASSKLPKFHHRDFTGEELSLGKAWLLTMNWMFRNVDLGFIPERHQVLNGDTFFTSIIGQFGGSHHHTDIKPSAYRIHEGGIWSSLLDKDKIEAQLNTYFWMYRYYSRIGEKQYAKVYLRKYRQRFADRFSIFEILSTLLIKISPISFFKINIRKALGDNNYEKLKKLIGR